MIVVIDNRDSLLRPGEVICGEDCPS